MSKTLKIYGLAHCSTCQKAVQELEAAGWAVDFRDVKTDPLSAGDWQEMIPAFGEKLVNRASLTWRGMTEAERSASPLDMLLAKPSLMKRPAIVDGDRRFLGWTANVKRAFGVAV